jgi:hypothetical protein
VKIFTELQMRIILSVLGCIIILLTFSCYAEIDGTVVDAETGKPIEGAVVLVEWTKTKGLPGMTHTEPYKVIEVVSDKNGKVTLASVLNPPVNPPRVTVYKKGYVAWNNGYIFPNWENRKDFRWIEGLVIKLAPFRNEYSRTDHIYFLHTVAHWGKKMSEAYRWEELEKEKQR